MLSASAEKIADQLWRYGEDETAVWILACSDDELTRVCSVAGWLLFHGPAPKSGGSMMIGKACSLAAVYVREGSPRELARQKRRAAPFGEQTPGDRPVMSGRRPSPPALAAVPKDYGVGDDARRYWSSAR